MWTCVLITLGIYLEVKLLGQIVTLNLKIWRIPKLVPKWLHHFISHQQFMRIPMSPQPHQYSLLSVFFIKATLVGVKSYLVVLICISWIIMLIIFSCAYWRSVYLLWGNAIQTLCPFFSWVIYYILIVISFSYFKINHLTDIWSLNIFSNSMDYHFTHLIVTFDA